MTSVALRMAQSAGFQFFRRNLGRLFSSKYLLATNTAISISLSGAGDILQQKYENLHGRQDVWDSTRTRNQCISGAVIGPTCHFWYLWLDRVLPGRTARIIAKKLLLDQLFMTPVCLTQFLSITSWLEGKDKSGFITEFRTKGVTLFITDCLIWPPAQLVNFYLVPTRFRVLYDNTISLCFDYYYSYVKYKKDYSDHACFKTTSESVVSNPENSAPQRTSPMGLADSFPTDICCDIHSMSSIHAMSSNLDRVESSINVENSVDNAGIKQGDTSEARHSSLSLYCHID